MTEAWRRWRYKRWEKRISSGEFGPFEQFVNGPWTLKMVSKMPEDVLAKGPQFGGIDAQTRRVIELEMVRRAQPTSAIVANVIAFVALTVSVIALFRP